MAAIIVRAFGSYTVQLDPPASALQETAASIAAKLDAYLALVGESDARIVGCVLAKQAEDAIYISRLAIEPAWHGRGMGRALMEAIETTARAQGARALTLGVRVVLPDVQRFYRACGFREIMREAHPGYAHPTFIRMEKVLA